MKIGDKVRFLSETGGGVIVGFKGSNIALVEDEDGFQIPTQLQDLVVVNDDKQARTALGGTMTRHDEEPATAKAPQEEKNPVVSYMAEKPHSVNVYERDNNDEINLMLGFVPKDAKNISRGSFYLYAINDCNYFISFTCSLPSGEEWNLLAHGELEPNTKQLIAEMNIEDVSDYANCGIQLTAYKIGKPFRLKPTMDVKLRIDPVKFYKAHTFRENDFFDEDALIVPVVEDSVPVKVLSVESTELQKKIIEKQRVDITAPARASKKKSANANEPLVIDLHISELLDSTAGMSHSEILNYQLEVFNKTLAENSGKKGKKIIFIHGKGEGVLRNAIIKELRYKYKSYSYQDASFQEYGYGATQVTIH